MKRSDPGEDGKAADAKETAADGLSRSGIAALLAAALLLVVSAGRWDKLAYPHYLGQIAFQCAVLALLVLWTFPRKSPPSVARRDAVLVAPYIGYGLYTILSCSWAFNRRLAFVGGAVQVTFPLVWAVGLGMLLRSKEDVRTVLRAVFVAGVIAAYASFFYVIRDATLEAVQHVQGHRNYLAAFLLPPLTIGLADLLSRFLAGGETSWRPLQWPRWLVLFGMLAMAVSLLLVFVRSIGALVGLMAAVVCLLAIRLSWRRRLIIVGVVLFLAVAALAVFGARPPPVTAWMMEHHSVGTRWFMWEGAVRMILDRPLIGWGPGNFILAFADYKPTEPMRYGLLGNFTIYPHNELLLVAAEGGLLALALYLAGHVVVARGVIRFADRSPEPEMRVLGWTLFAAALAMFVHAQLDVILRFWAPSALFWTLIGLMIATARLGSFFTTETQSTRRQPPDNSPQPVLRALRVSVVKYAWVRVCIFVATLICVVGLGVGVVWSGARAEWLLGGGGPGKDATPDQVVRSRAEAARLSRYVPDYLIALKKRGDALWQEGDLAAAIASYEELERTAPGYGQTRQVLGELYYRRAKEIGPRNEAAAKADLEKSAQWLDQAVRQNPYNVATRMLLARVLLQASRRNLPAALDQASAAVKADPKSAEAHFLLGAFLSGAEQKERALAELDRAAALCAPSSDLARRIQAVRESIEAKPSPAH